MSLLNTARRVVGQARSYASRNPHKIHEFTDKAARFVDTRTNGKYRKQINDAVRKVDGFINHGQGSGSEPPGRAPR